MDRRPDALLPQRPDERFVLSRPRLLVGQDVKQQAEWPHVQGHQDESPLHHVGFGVVAVLVPSDICRRRRSEREPDQQEIVDRLNEHWSGRARCPERNRGARRGVPQRQTGNRQCARIVRCQVCAARHARRICHSRITAYATAACGESVRRSEVAMTLTPTPGLAVVTVTATLAYLGLAILGWGGFAAFFSDPARIVLTIATFLLSGAALFSSGNLSPG